ncbi:hypothetical protein CBP76_10525 [Companilactobacillus nuruki]|uniref:Uncharacterized protein n=1 Tax=Companilactobacillus nuruki TaxID=1993540 RepID=A0A2N7ARR8_9LACO|nr:hypothetical protein CBP76_10525 [Companilactobacillus nuruki]
MINSKDLPDIDITEALNCLIITINGLVENINIDSSILDKTFDKFIKALSNGLIRLLDNAS